MPDKPAFDLTNSNISDTFTGLIQVRDTDNTIYDGVGDRLNDFRVSGSFTTSDTVTSTNINSQFTGWHLKGKEVSTLTQWVDNLITNDFNKLIIVSISLTFGKLFR